MYYGGQAYGVEAAARHYFGVKASKLNLPQAATLAGLVQAPSATDPIRSPAKALARRNVVLDRMHTLGLITDKAWQSARKSKMVLNSKPAQNSCALSPYPYFCNYIKAWLLEQPALGKTPAERAKRINQGGLTIQTTLNPKIQTVAQQEINAKIPPGSKMGKIDIGAAAAVIEPGTGNVLAIAQNTTYAIKKSPGKTSVNWAVDAKYGGSGGFAFGSTAKMFAVATALNSGMPISSTVIARTADATHPAVFYRSDYPKGDKCAVPKGQAWAVRNDEGTRNGRISLTDATAFSVNTAFAGLVAKLGACKVRDMMTNLGLHRGGDGKPISYNSRTGGPRWPPDHAGFGQRLAADAGLGLRHDRLGRHVLRALPGAHHHHQRQEAAPAAQGPVPQGPRAGRGQRCHPDPQDRADQGHRLRQQTLPVDVPWPARPAPPTTATRPGSSATPRS